MGFTNVHHAEELLRNAGRTQCTPAIVPNFQRFVTIIGHYFEQEELDAFAEVLRHPKKDVWLHWNNAKYTFQPGLADSPIDRPSVRTSSRFEDKEEHRATVRQTNEPEDTSPKPALAYVLVVRGKSAALCSKVRILYTLDAAAAAMYVSTTSQASQEEVTC